MAHKRLFDHGGVNVVATPDDQILGASRDVQIAVRVQPPQIAGAQEHPLAEQPPVLVQFGIGRSGRHAGACNANLAHLVHGAIQPATSPIGVQDADMGIGKRNADRPNLFLTLWRIDRHQTGTFRQAVAFDDLHAGGFLKALVQLDRQRRRPRESAAQGVDPGIDRPLQQRGQRGRHRHQIGHLPAFDQLPQVVENPVAPIPRRRGKDHMPARGYHRHQDRIGRKDMEQRHRAHHDIGFAKQQTRAQPAVVNHAARPVLCNLGQARGAAGVEIRRDAVRRIIDKGQCARLRGTGLGETNDPRRVRGGEFRPQDMCDPGLGDAEIGRQIDLDHRSHARCQGHRFGNALRQFGLGERAQRHHDLGAGFAQDGRNMLGFQQRVDRVDDTRNCARDQRHNGFQTIRQHIGHHIAGPDTQRAKQVGGLRHPAMQVAPGQRLRPGPRCRLQLKRHRRPVAMRRLGAADEFVQGPRLAPRLP